MLQSSNQRYNMKQTTFSDQLATSWMNTNSANTQSAAYALQNLDLNPDLNLESLHAMNLDPTFTHLDLDLHPLVKLDLHLHLIHMNMDLDLHPLMNPELHLDPQLDPIYPPSIQLNGTLMLPLRTSVRYGSLASKQHTDPANHHSIRYEVSHPPHHQALLCGPFALQLLLPEHHLLHGWPAVAHCLAQRQQACPGICQWTVHHRIPLILQIQGL